jgi:ABC-type amino acid transport substrate-binding protein
MSTSRAAAVAAVTALSLVGGVAAAASLQDVQRKGRLHVAVYREFAPFSDDGKGVDVDLAKALAAKLGVEAEIEMIREADDVDGDLRNVIWKGHYLRNAPLADVMMHVPVDEHLMKKNEQVKIFAPYFRDRIVVARNRNRIPNLPTLEPFATAQDKIGVQSETLEDNYLLTAFGGALRERVLHFGTIESAVAAMRKGEVSAVMGREAFLEAALGPAREGVVIAPVATPGLRISGWELGLAVKADATDLAAALEKAMAELRQAGAVERIFAARGLTYLPPRPASG